MTFTGTVSNGIVKLPPEAKLPDGTQVRIETTEDISPPIGKKLLEFAGILKDLPEDFAENHDHYVHGTPKRPVP